MRRALERGIDLSLVTSPGLNPMPCKGLGPERRSVTVHLVNKVLDLLLKAEEVGTRPPFHLSESIFPVCLLRRQQGLLPGQLPSKCHGNRHHSLQLSTLPLGHLHGDGAARKGCRGSSEDAPASSGGRGVSRRWQAPPPPTPACAVAEHRSLDRLAQALRICQPARPPVRSPARWGSMAGSPLLGGPRAGGVGLLVLLLLGLLRPPAALCARPGKVRSRSGNGGGEDATPASLALAPRMAETSVRVARGIRPLGLWGFRWQYLGLSPQPRPAHPSPRPWRCPGDQHILREGMRSSMCVRAWDVMTGGEVWCPCACPLM